MAAGPNSAVTVAPRLAGAAGGRGVQGYTELDGTGAQGQRALRHVDGVETEERGGRGDTGRGGDGWA